MTTATGYITQRVDFSFDESKYEKEQALQTLIANGFKSTEEVKIDHKEFQVSI